MSFVADFARAFIGPYVRIGKAVGRSKLAKQAFNLCVGAPLRSAASLWINLTCRWPEANWRVIGKAMEKGDGLCYGKLAPLTIAPGMMLRDGARLAKKCHAPIFWIAGLGGLGAACAAAAALCPPLTLATLPGFLALSALFYAPAGFALDTAGAISTMMLGAIAGSIPAFCSIPTGIKRRQEAFEAEERAKRDAGRVGDEELGRMSMVEKAAYFRRYALSTAQPEERAAWFEALKAKFPEEFAAAARPQSDELSPVLARDVQFQKPLRFKAKAGAEQRRWSLGRLLGR